MKSRVTRGLMWAHYFYLMLLPATASLAAGMQEYSDGFLVLLLLAGSLPVMGYLMILANGYTLPDSLPVALFVALAVPLQIAASIILFGDRALWLFFAENAAVEVGAFLPAIIVAKWRHNPEERNTTLLFAPIVLISVAPFFVLVFNGYGGASLWLLLFATAYLTAFLEYKQLYTNAIRAYVKSGGQLQEVEMKYDGGFLTKLFGSDEHLKVITPFYKRRKANEVNWTPAVLGLLFWIFFIIAGGIGKQWVMTSTAAEAINQRERYPVAEML